MILVATLIVKLAEDSTFEEIADCIQLCCHFFSESFRISRDTMSHAITYQRVPAETGLVTALDALTCDYLLRRPVTMVILADPGFHGATSDLANLKICTRGTWNTRMPIETVLSL